MSLDISRVFGVAFQTLGQRFGSLLGLWATFTAIQFFSLLVGGVAMFGVFAAAVGVAQPSSAGALGALGAGSILMLVVFYLALIALFLAQQAALFHMGSPLHRPDFGNSFKAGWRSAVPLLGATLIYLVGYMVLFVPLTFVTAMAGANGSMVSGALSLLMFPVLMYLACRLSMVNPIVSVEGVGNPVAAIRRSWSMTRGHALPIFLIMLVFGVALLLVGGVALWPMISAGMGAAMGQPPAQMASFGFMSFILFFVLMVAVALFSATLFSAIHAELAGGLESDTADTFA